MDKGKKTNKKQTKQNLKMFNSQKMQHLNPTITKNTGKRNNKNKNSEMSTIYKMCFQC